MPAVTTFRLAQLLFGWMALSGVLHVGADVFTPLLRQAPVPGTDRSLYFGLHSAYALGHVAAGLIGLWALMHVDHAIGLRPLLLLGTAISIGWLALALTFIPYRPPRANDALLVLLAVVALLRGVPC